MSTCVSQYFVVLGVAAACLSTALGSMFGSARIMQAIARDDVYPVLAPLKRGAQRGDEPRRALLVTYLLAQTGLLVGGIDAVAPVLTNFFLVTYALTNLSAALLELSGCPNFRPLWCYYSWQLSLVGAALTLGAMLFLNPSFAAVTVAIVVVLYAYISLRQDLDVNNAKGWADISQALAFNAASASLRSLARQRPSAKYWRPALLLLLPQHAAAECVSLAVHLASGGLLLAGRALTPHDGSSSGSGGGGGSGGGAGSGVAWAVA